MTTSLQDRYLKDHQNKPIIIYLTSGIKLQGVIASFDQFCIELVRSGNSQLVYKSAISTIGPLLPLEPKISGP